MTEEPTFTLTPEEETFTVVLVGRLRDSWYAAARSPWEAAQAVRRGDGTHRDQEWDGDVEARVIVEGVELRALPDEDSFEFTIGPHDHHLRLEGEGWVLDTFLTAEADHDRAHLDSETFDRIEHAIHAAQAIVAARKVGA